MKVNEFKNLVREAVKKTLSENQPAPAKPERGTEVHPGKPGEKPKPRRGFEPKPGAEPKPKAMAEGEKQIVDKIVQRMRSKKEVNESVYLDPKSNKELDLQWNGRQWEIEIRKKGDLSFSKPTIIKRDTLEQIKDWCKQYNLPTDWIKEKEINEAESSIFKIDPKLAGKIHDILEKEGIDTGMTKTFFFHFLNDRL